MFGTVAQITGGCQPTPTQRRRASTMTSLLVLSAIMVARPIAVNPRRRTQGLGGAFAASRPELFARQRGAFGHGPHLCPADVRVDAVAVPTIGAGDDIFAPHDPGVGQETIRDQFGGLYSRRLVGDDPGMYILPSGSLTSSQSFQSSWWRTSAASTEYAWALTVSIGRSRA